MIFYQWIIIHSLFISKKLINRIQKIDAAREGKILALLDFGGLNCVSEKTPFGIGCAKVGHILGGYCI